jgi:hypothetical protein
MPLIQGHAATFERARTLSVCALRVVFGKDSVSKGFGMILVRNIEARNCVFIVRGKVGDNPLHPCYSGARGHMVEYVLV